jgi:hypothetical protein
MANTSHNTRIGTSRELWRRGCMVLAAAALLSVLTPVLYAQGFSQVLSFQGRLCGLDGKPLPDGPYAVQFTIYDAEVDGNTLWTESQGVTQVGGVFAVYLGSVTGFPAALFKDGNRWLGIKVGGDPEMAQRFKFAPAPWAIYANDSNRVDGFHASQTPTPNYILPLDAGGKFPQSVLPPSNDWSLAGNTGTNPPTTFLGTTDNKPLVIKTNGTEAMRVDSTGYVGIGGLPSSYWRLAVSNTSGGAGSFTTTGTGEAGVFQISNTSNSNPAVLATTDGGGEAVKGFTTGSGIAGSFGINNASSTNPTLLASTNGLGNAIWARIDSAGNSSAALRSRTFGTGPAGYFEIDNPSNGSAAVEARTNGNGRAIWGYTDKGIAGDFEVTDTSGNGWAVYGHTVGLGSAGEFATTNSGNSEPALEAFTWGTGPAGKFYINNGSSGSAAVDAYTNGDGAAVSGRTSGGTAGRFILENSDSPNSALYAETTGYGPAVCVVSHGRGLTGLFENWDSNSSEAVLVGHTFGTGSVAVFNTANATGTEPTLIAEHAGHGPAARFLAMRTDNYSPAVEAISAGQSFTTNVISGRYVGAAADAVAVYGESVPSDWYGVGGSFQGGYIGARGQVYPTGGNTYCGLYGYVSGGTGTNCGVFGIASGNGTNFAGYFAGNVKVTGYLYKDGGGFQIDHPLDPANMYLNHSFVESPDMKNVYDGVVLLDGAGEAWVELPEWFGALNGDFRYQLTAIGAPGPNLYIAEEIADNRFKIAGGAPGMKVSWQVTGIRHDPYAEAHRIPVEEIKPPHARGLYEHPELYGRPEWEGVGYAIREKTDSVTGCHSALPAPVPVGSGSRSAGDRSNRPGNCTG